MSDWNTNSWSANDAAPSTTWNDMKAAQWNTGAGNSATFYEETPAVNNDSFNQNGYEATAGGEGLAAGEGGDGQACRICKQIGHFSRECPDKPDDFGKCFNCGEEGHNKAECTNPKIFTGTCRVCAQAGHQARDCPDKPPTLCRNCKQEGHITCECTNNKVFDLESIATLPVEEAWANVVKTAKEAVESRDLDDFRGAIKVYTKAVKDVSYDEIERSFRANEIGIYLIATEPKDGEVLDTNTLINLAGKRDCKYKVGYFFKKTPRTAKMAEGWPSSEEENLERLKDAGVPYDRGIPKCLRCKEMGHTMKDCKEEKVERGEVVLKCANCGEDGHRVRDCKAARVDRFACRNCKQSGHESKECPEPRSAEGVECNRCQEIGHFGKDCPTNPGGGSRACRNCGEEGHISKECEKPKNPANSTCRNCDQVGHFSKDCPEPKNWDKVKCNTCGEMGHTVKKCPQAQGGNGDGGVGVDNADAAGYTNGDNWDAGNGEAGNAADDSWQNGGAAVDASSTWATAPATVTGGGW